MAPDEPTIFARWLEAVRAEPSLRDAEVVVRPHPAGEAWLDWTPPGPRVSLQRPEQKVETEALAELLARADAVVALNTSAEIEAAIAGRPVLTFRAGEDAPGQEGSIHFAYLLEQNGGFVLDADTLEEHVSRLAGVLAEQARPRPASSASSSASCARGGSTSPSLRSSRPRRSSSSAPSPPRWAALREAARQLVARGRLRAGSRGRR